MGRRAHHEIMGGGFRLLLALGMLQGCTVVDRFGPRAITYNEQMARAREHLILENIIRSGFDLPLQFSEISTVQGSSSAQASFGTSLPFAGARGTGSRLFSAAPAFQVSGGPSFNESNLNSQEFMSGIATPLKNEILANYVAGGTRRETILFLTVAAIDFDTKGEHFHFDADPRRLDEFQKFSSVLGAFIHKGLSFEVRESATYVGPPLSPGDVRTGRILNEILKKDGVDGAKLELVHYEMSDGKARAALSASELVQLKRNGTADFYRVKKAEKTYRFCIARQTSGDDWGHPQLAAGSPPPVAVEFGYSRGHPESPIKIDIGSEFQCGAEAARGGANAPKPTFDNLKMTLRSVRGMFDFLGQLSASELRAQRPGMYDVAVGRNEVLRIIGFEATHDAGAVTAPVVGGVRTTSVVAVPIDEVEGANDAERAAEAAKLVMSDESHRSVQLLSEFMALYSSAKSLPTPNVIPFFTP